MPIEPDYVYSADDRRANIGFSNFPTPVQHDVGLQGQKHLLLPLYSSLTL